MNAQLSWRLVVLLSVTIGCCTVLVVRGLLPVSALTHVVAVIGGGVLIPQPGQGTGGGGTLAPAAAVGRAAGVIGGVLLFAVRVAIVVYVVGSLAACPPSAGAPGLAQQTDVAASELEQQKCAAGASSRGEAIACVERVRCAHREASCPDGGTSRADGGGA